MSATTTALLSALLPSTPYLLIFSLPLLLVSLVLTFAGAFLTLDRTRSFPPSYDAIPGSFDQRRKKHKLHWLLEGGVGGLAAGYAFGVHCSTFLALLIPSLTSSAALSPASFLPVWLLSALVTTGIAGRWKYIALAFSGISGGATLALAVSVIIHPSLLTRIILVGITLPILAIFVLLPIRRTQHASLRVALSSAGAFGAVLSIALLAHVPAWADVWDRLWVSDSSEWGTTTEKGLSAAFCFLLSGGIACDWALRYKFGENPDQKWDNYLANYASDLPNASNRAGVFRPLSSFWSRLFGRHPKAVTPPLADTAEIVFPTDADLKLPILSSPIKLQKNQSRRGSAAPARFTPPPELLRKPTHTRFHARGFGFRSREALKFSPGGYTDSSDSESELDELKTPPPPPLVDESLRPWSKRPPSLTRTSSATLSNGRSAEAGEIDFEKEMTRIRAALRAGNNEVPEYSDYEEDVTTLANANKPTARDQPGWSPGFLQRNGTQYSGSGSSSHRTAVEVPTTTPLIGAMPVPATPSLIRAIDRITVAQQAAFTSVPRPGLPPSKSSDAGMNEGLPKRPLVREGHQGARWDDFWRDVHAKAGIS